MTYGNRINIIEPTTPPRVVEYHDWVRWGPIISGVVVAISTQLILSVLGSAIGLTTLADATYPRAYADEVGMGVGIWSIISLFIALFLGSWFTARTCGSMKRSTALLNGAILWATTLAIGSLLLVNGVAGLFGSAIANTAVLIDRLEPGAVTNRITGITPTEAQVIADNIAKFSLAFVLGSLLGLIASMIGAAVGARKPRTYRT